MTQAEWRWTRPENRSDVLRLVDYLRSERNCQRKALLALCALCRNTWNHIAFECNWRALEASEDYADGLITQEVLKEHWRNTRFEPLLYCEWVCAAAGPAYAQGHWKPMSEQDHAALVAFHSTLTDEVRLRWCREELMMALDVLDFAFRSFAFSPHWRTDTVMVLARTMYESRDFNSMPILADALQDAECDNDDILNHCRGSGPHVRGCWVVDNILSKDR